MTFKLVNGVPQAFDGDGQTARTGKDGMSPMTLAEWWMRWCPMHRTCLKQTLVAVPPAPAPVGRATGP